MQWRSTDHRCGQNPRRTTIVWKPKKAPSPFITETATKIFTSVPEALKYFEQDGNFAEKNLFGN